MSTVSFDTLKFATRLQAGGFTRDQATAAAEAFAEATGEELATKADLNAGLAGVRSQIVTVRADLQQQILEVRNDLQQQILEVKNDLQQRILEVKNDLQQQIIDLKNDLQQQISALRTSQQSDTASLRAEMRELELRMTIKLGGLIVGATGLILAAMRYLPPGHP